MGSGPGGVSGRGVDQLNWKVRSIQHPGSTVSILQHKNTINTSNRAWTVLEICRP